MLGLFCCLEIYYIQGMKTTQPNPDNGSSQEIAEAIKCSDDQRYIRRLHAIKLLIEGFSKQDVARIYTVSVRSIQKWIKLWNDGGLDNLKIRIRPPTHARIPVSQHQALFDLLCPPDSDDKNECPLTVRQIHGYVKEELRINLGYSTLTRFYREHDFRLKFPRPWPLEQDEELRSIFREEISALLNDEASELWFSDETGITADPRPRRVWALKSDRPRVFYHGSHIRENVIGAINPRTGEFISLIMPGVNTVVFQIFLDELSSRTDKRNITLILDNATWHKAKALKWHSITPMYLPPYSPDLNPIERLWLYIKEHYFRNWFTKSREELQDRIIWAIRQIMKVPEVVKSVTRCELSC